MQISLHLQSLLMALDWIKKFYTINEKQQTTNYGNRIASHTKKTFVKL